MQMLIGPDPSQHQTAARLPKWAHKALRATCTSVAELGLFPTCLWKHSVGMPAADLHACLMGFLYSAYSLGMG
jgi:hypothetical protein